MRWMQGTYSFLHMLKVATAMTMNGADEVGMVHDQMVVARDGIGVNRHDASSLNAKARPPVGGTVPLRGGNALFTMWQVCKNKPYSRNERPSYDVGAKRNRTDDRVPMGITAVKALRAHSETEIGRARR